MKTLLLLIGCTMPYLSAIYAQTAADYRQQALHAIQLQQYPQALHFFQCEWALRQQQAPDAALLKTAYNIAEVYRGTARYDSALVWASKSWALHQQFYGDLHPESLDAALLLAQNQYLARRHEALAQSLAYLFDKAQETTNFNPDWQAKLYILAASHDADFGDYTAALQRYQFALKLQNNPDLAARIYNNMAALKTNEHRWLEALTIYDKALALRLQHLGETHPNTANIYENQAVAYLGLGQYAAALALSRKALHIYRNIYGEQHPKIAWSYLNISNVQRKQAQPDSAMFYCDKALALYQQTMPKGSPEMGYAWLCKARLQADAKRISSAINCYQEALAQPLNEADIALAHSEWAALEMQAQHWQSALLHCRLALALSPKDYLLPSLEACQATRLDKKLFLQLLYQSAQCRHALQQPSLAYQELRLALHLGHSWRHQIALQSDQSALLELLEPIAELGLALCYQLHQENADEYYLSEAFACMESNKSLHLWRFWRNQESPTLRKLWQTEQAWQQADVSLRPALLKKLFALRQACDSLPLPAPLLAFANAQLTLEQAQENTAAHCLALEYFWGKNALYRLCFNKNTAFLDKINLSDISVLTDFLQQLSGVEHEDKSQWESKAQHFGATAFSLFQCLIPKDVSEDNSQLLIIPDGKLQLLAWEALCSESPSPSARFLNLPYLLRRWSVNYAYSMAVYVHQQHKKQQNNGEILAMAVPHEAQPLARSHWELEQLQHRFAGNYYQDQTATESAFKQAAPHYAVLHLATHGYVSASATADAHLFFSPQNDTQNDGILHSEEAALLPLQADLVVLNACQTGLGRQVEGEGIMSLARGFVYAGAPSLVLSLWQIHDQSSSEIIDDFYQYLSLGYAKDRALQQAKLNFLEQASQYTAHPHFWAGLVCLGSRQPVQISSPKSHKNIYLSGIFLFTSITLVIRFRYKQITKSKKS